MTRQSLLLLASAALLFAAPQAAAEIPVRTLTGYTVTSFNAGDGVTLGSIRALAQDRDGYLWVGSESGLYRFDGIHFTPAERLPGAAIAMFSVRSLHFTRSGDLWVGATSGGIILLRNGQVVPGGNPPDITGAVNAIAEDAAGAIWVGHEGGLLRFFNGRWTVIGGNDGFPATRVLHLRVSGDALYVGTASGLLVRTGAGAFTAVPGSGDQPIRDSADDGAGTSWVTHPLHGFTPVGGRTAYAGGPAGRGSDLLRDSRGHLWIATIGQGLWRLSTGATPAIERITVQNGLLTDGIWSLLEDREGNLWVGTHEGLNRLTRHSMMPVGGLGITTSVVRGARGMMWAASTDGVIAFPPGSRPDVDRTVFPLEGVRTIHVDARGTVWAAAGTLHRLVDGRFRPLPQGGFLRRVTAMASDSRNVLWVADSAQGLWRWDGRTLIPHQMPASLRATRIVALYADRHDTVWVAFEGGQLAAIGADGRVSLYGKSEGLPYRRITGLAESDAGGLWITGDVGLSRLLDGRIQTIGRDHDLIGGMIAGVVDDREGGLWLSINRTGLARLSVEDFARSAAGAADRVPIQIFDTSDGMAGMPIALDARTSARADDGRLWVVTGRGLTIVEPSVARARPRSIGPVRVEAAVADDRSFETTAATTLPAGLDRLRIDYTALSLTAPEHTRFRYRLIGFDDAWRDAGSRRQAFYTNLPPRTYRFQVQAEGGDANWNRSTADWTFSIAPHFYQTPAFYALCILAVGVMLAATWQIRLRHVRHEFNIVLAERARLSREVHDTLLQTMVGVSLQIDNVAKTSPAPPGQAEQLVTIRREIEECIVEARQSIWNLRATGGGNGDLIAALEVAGARATKRSPVKFKLSVAGTPCRAGECIEGEILRIAQEALANAVRHAQAANVIVELHYQRDAVTLRVVDDGTGFEASARVETHHFGLATMRERAEQLGGRFSLTTAIGAGTQIETSIPLSQRA